MGVLKKKKKTSPFTSSSLVLPVTDRKLTNYVSTQWISRPNYITPMWRFRATSEGKRSGPHCTIRSQVVTVWCDARLPMPLRACTVHRTLRWCAVWRTDCGSCLCFPSGQLWDPATSGWSQLSSPWLCEPAAGTAEGAPVREGSKGSTLQTLTGEAAWPMHWEAKALLVKNNHDSSWGRAILLHSYLQNSQ